MNQNPGISRSYNNGGWQVFVACSLFVLLLSFPVTSKGMRLTSLPGHWFWLFRLLPPHYQPAPQLVHLVRRIIPADNDGSARNWWQIFALPSSVNTALPMTLESLASASWRRTGEHVMSIYCHRDITQYSFLHNQCYSDAITVEGQPDYSIIQAYRVQFGNRFPPVIHDVHSQLGVFACIARSYQSSPPAPGLAGTMQTLFFQGEQDRLIRSLNSYRYTRLSSVTLQGRQNLFHDISGHSLLNLGSLSEVPGCTLLRVGRDFAPVYIDEEGGITIMLSLPMAIRFYWMAGFCDEEQDINPENWDPDGTDGQSNGFPGLMH